jgi:zinc D-Ala-D-Ala dipeptidase
MVSAKPIPSLATDPDTSSVQICDSGDGLVRLETGNRIHVQPAYHARGFLFAQDHVVVRHGTRTALENAARALPAGLSLLVWDGLRSLSLQREVGLRFERQLITTPLAPQERQQRLAKYVSPIPADELKYQAAPPPHATGGAVDVSLSDSHGRALNMGADFDQFADVAHLAHFEGIREAELDAQDKTMRTRRRLLYWAMTSAGFAPYVWEFWHFEYKTLRAAAHYGRTIAEYGPSSPWQDTSGQTLAVNNRLDQAEVGRPAELILGCNPRAAC